MKETQRTTTHLVLVMYIYICACDICLIITRVKHELNRDMISGKCVNIISKVNIVIN